MRASARPRGAPIAVASIAVPAPRSALLPRSPRWRVSSIRIVSAPTPPGDTASRWPTGMTQHAINMTRAIPTTTVRLECHRHMSL